MFGKGYHRQKVIENILVYIDAYILVGRGGGGGVNQIHVPFHILISKV